MRLTRFFVALFGLLLPINALHADTEKSAVTGVVTFKGIPIKSKPLDLSERTCLRQNALCRSALVRNPSDWPRYASRMSWYMYLPVKHNLPQVRPTR